MEKKIKPFLALTAALISATPAVASEILMNTAQMQAMDKITGRVSIIEVPVGGEIKFGSFSVVVRSCQTRSEEEIPENFAFVDVTDKSFDQEEFNIFKGWMLSSSPAVHAVEHPIYDVWLLKCINSEIKPEQLLSIDELNKRDMLPRLHDIRQQQKEQEKNTFEEEPANNIEFKDSMYKELPASEKNAQQPAKHDGPENLLNISESFEETTDPDITIPAKELSEALKEGQKSLEQKNRGNSILETSPQTEDDELTNAINEELAKHAL